MCIFAFCTKTFTSTTLHSVLCCSCLDRGRLNFLYTIQRTRLVNTVAQHRDRHSGGDNDDDDDDDNDDDNL